jgi:hypothetical protein
MAAKMSFALPAGWFTSTGRWSRSKLANLGWGESAVRQKRTLTRCRTAERQTSGVSKSAVVGSGTLKDLLRSELAATRKLDSPGRVSASSTLAEGQRRAGSWCEHAGTILEPLRTFQRGCASLNLLVNLDCSRP